MSETKTVIGADTPLRDAAPSAPEVLQPGSTWTGPDGTVYDVVRAEDVGDRPRWLVPVGFRGDQVGLEEPDELHTDAAPGGAGMLLALVLRDHRAASDSECRASGAEILARAREHNVIAADELPGVLAAIDEVRNGPEEHRGPAPRFSLESARAMLANLEHLPPDVSADDARVDLWVELREACDEVERLQRQEAAATAQIHTRIAELEDALGVPGRRDADPFDVRLIRATTTAQHLLASAEERRARWNKRARKAEARVTVLTEERDGLTLRLGKQERKRVQRSKAKAGTRKGGR